MRLNTLFPNTLSDSDLTFSCAKFREAAKFLLGRERLRILTLTNIFGISTSIAAMNVNMQNEKYEMLKALQENDQDTIKILQEKWTREQTTDEFSVDGLVHYMNSIFKAARDMQDEKK